MYPTISDLLHDLFGINIPLPIQSFGFFVALSFVAAAYCFTKELQRKERQGLIKSSMQKVLKGAPVTTSEIAFSGIFGFVIGFKVLYIILNYKAFVDNPQQAILSTEGSIIGGLLIAGISLYFKYREKEKTKLSEPKEELVEVHPYELVANMTMIAAVSGLLGAKIFHNLENIDDFIADPMGALLSFSGLTFYGGLIAGAISVIWYARKNNIPTLHLIDACAPGLMLAYGLGRVGCQVAGDGDWGINNLNPKPNWLSFIPDWAWAYRYPHNVIGEGVPIPGCEGHHCNQLALPVYPTPLYEAIMGIGLFFFLWGIRKNVKTPGVLFCIYLIVNGIERFFIEKIRVNTLYHIGNGVTQAEIISTLLVITGIAGIIILKKKQPAFIN